MLLPYFIEASFGYLLYALFPFAVYSVRCILAQCAGRKAADGYVFQVVFLTISGTTFFLVVLTASPSEISLVYFPLIVGAFIASWLFGLITPGLPAGLGLREAGLLFFLENYFSNEVLITAVLLMRVITVCGDIIFFFISAMFLSKKNVRP